MEIPAEILARLRAADAREGADLGIGIAAEPLEALRGRIQGAFILPPFGRYATVPRLLERLSRPSPRPEDARP